MNVKDSIIVKEAINSVKSLIGSTQIETSLQPCLLRTVLETSIDCPEKPETFELNINRWNNQSLYDEICLTSGGADSTIAWFYFNKPKAIYIDIGQAYHAKEKDSLRRLGIPAEVIHLAEFDVTNLWKHIIPGRNFLFLTIAAEMLKHEGKIYFACTEGEGWNSNKGDKSSKFICDWQTWYKAVTGKNIFVQTLVADTKPGWLKSFRSKGFDVNLIRYKTVTCFSDSENYQCGECQACLRKFLSFITAFNLYTNEDYNVHPMIGCEEYIHKYIVKMQECLKTKNFSHYSARRCEEDLTAIHLAYTRLRKS